MLKLKNINIIIFLIIIVLFFIVSGNKYNTVNLNLNNNEKIKIGVAIYKQDDKFISNIMNEFTNYAKEKELRDKLSIKVDIVDAKGNQSIQNEQLDNFINKKYDVLCINLVDRTVAFNIIDKAKNADIPIVFFNREPVEEDINRWDKVYYVGSEAIYSGILEGRLIANKYIEEPKSIDKNSDGKIQYVILEGEQGHQDALLRTDFCIKTVKNAGIEVEKLANDTANWQRAQGADKMAKWIEKFGDNIEVVFSNNDDMALGAIDKIYSPDSLIKDNPPAVVGIDGIPEALDAIEKGYMLGTVENNSRLQAQTIFNLAYSLAKDEDIKNIDKLENGKYIRIPYRQVTKDNVNNFKHNNIS